MTKTRRGRARTLPPEGITQEEWDAMPRQKRYQISREARGICVSCGKAPILRTRLCAKCLAAQRERMRSSQSCVGRRRRGSISYAAD